MLNLIFYWIGILFTLFTTFKLLFRFIRFLKGHYAGSPIDFKSLGTAVITGSTDGIGKAYAIELARQGLDLVLISRTQSKLDATAEEIQSMYPSVKIRSISADFSEIDIYDKIERELVDVDVGMLVNNVGTVLEASKLLHETRRETVFKMININMTSALLMSQIVIGKMVANGRKGVVVNVSSASVKFPTKMELYASVKTFVSRLSRGLRRQYTRFGIVVQEVEPFLVQTKLAVYVKGRFTVTPETYARQSLATIGHYDTTGGAVRHDVFGFLISMLPQYCLEKMAEFSANRSRRAFEALKKAKKS